MTEKEKIKKVYENMEKMEFEKILIELKKFGVSLHDIPKPHFKRQIIQEGLKDIFINKPHLKEIFLNKFGGHHE